MVNFNLFVLPFFLGLIYMLSVIARTWYRWIKNLPAADRDRFTTAMQKPGSILPALWEVFMEALIHRRMWKRNPLLGYMHMSFALGWFLLIVTGNLESRLYSGTHLNAPYYPIFLKFFIHDSLVIFFETFTVPGFFRFLMDLLLLFVLSGLVLALLKRQHSRIFGMRRTTGLQLTDRVALAALWLIFPMRLLAESITAGYYGGGGGFLTQPLGSLLVSVFPIHTDVVAYSMWWGYSLSLGIFFISLPASRYMHIPTEILLILFRHAGIRPSLWYSSMSDTEVMACSRCGVCLDVCPMNEAGIYDAQAVYFIGDLRDRYVPEGISRKCLLCGRCQAVCPVGISTDSLRLIKRRELVSGQISDFSFLPRIQTIHPVNTEIIYFSGCMSHLTPSIPRAFKSILRAAGVTYLHLDEERSVCCGRPLKLAGKDRQAEDLVAYNKQLLEKSGATRLVTSCPICLRVFREEYGLSIPIEHHASFILRLVQADRIRLKDQEFRVAYHDPCDLGRGSGEYEAPRDLLRQFSSPATVDEERENAICCGGGVGLFTATEQQRRAMTTGTLQVLLADSPDRVATACPLCKKTLERTSPVPVKDIAELVADALIPADSGPAFGQSRPAESFAAGWISA